MNHDVDVERMRLIFASGFSLGALMRIKELLANGEHDQSRKVVDETIDVILNAIDHDRETAVIPGQD